MTVVTYSQLRQQLAAVMDQVCDSAAPVIVTRQNARSVVMLSLEEYREHGGNPPSAPQPRNAERLARAIAQADAGELTEAEPAA